MTSLSQTSRFLMTTTLGVDESLLHQVFKTGTKKWLDQQLNQPFSNKTPYQTMTTQIWKNFRSQFLQKYGKRAINGDGNNPALPYKWYFHMAWWHLNLNEQTHLLRGRIALALSELLVISDKSSLELNAIGMASYYDLLYRHAFGNYADLLTDVSLHPCMGVYLSHMNNQKAEPSQNIHPDENYAREIMQLFTIGLFELNQDGSRKQLAGKDIPTYSNTDIRELARVFTGLKAHSYHYEWTSSFWESSYNGYPVAFDDGIEKAFKTVPFIDMTKPMVAEQTYHDTGAKSLLKGRISIPKNQLAITEVRSAVHQLVAHPNTAPFVAKHLIQQLVTANPSKDYIKSVAKKFGKTGNLKAVIREIFTYPMNDLPAKTRLPSAKKQGGKLIQSQLLKSPLLRITQILRAMNVSNKSGKLWLIGDDIDYMVEQHPLSSPTVFNFYQNDYAPHAFTTGTLSQKQLVAPRFQLVNSATSIGYVNQMYYMIFGDFLPAVSTDINYDPNIKNAPELDPFNLNENNKDKLSFNYDEFIPMASDPSKHGRLIDRLGVLLTGESILSNKLAIQKAIANYPNNPKWVIQTIVFFIVVSAEYVVLKG